MKSTTRDEFDQLADHMSQMVNNLWQWHTGDFCPIDTWSPPINLYRLKTRIEVCVDLAGVEPQSIDLRIEPGQLVIRGSRRAPEPRQKLPQEKMQILAMEIDHGRFCRTVALPSQVDLVKVESEYEAGLLWIRLPLRSAG